MKRLLFFTFLLAAAMGFAQAPALPQGLGFEISTPASIPPAGTELYYLKTNAGLCSKTSAGVEICPGSGGGAGSFTTVTASSSVTAPQYCIGASCITVWPSGGGGGISTFSAGNLPPLFTTTVTNPTTTPALSFTLSNAAQNSVLAGPALGGAGAPSYQTAPTFSAANLTSFPTFNQNTTGTAAGLSGTPALPNGTTATTQTTGDTSTKIATDAFVAAALGSGIANITVAVSSGSQGANSCSSVQTAAMTGLVVTSPPSAISPGYSSDPTSLTGWGSTGGMEFKTWASGTNTASYRLCNVTGSTISYSAITFVLSAK